MFLSNICHLCTCIVRMLPCKSLEAVDGCPIDTALHGQCYAKTKVTFTATEHLSFANTKLYCLVTVDNLPTVYDL